MIKDFRFKTKIKTPYDNRISVFGIDPELSVHDSVEVDVEFNYGLIEWEFYVELREYGIKYMDIKLISADFEITYLNMDGEEIDTIAYTLKDFEKHVVEFDINFDKSGNRHAELTEFTIDFFEKQLTLIIN